jgi:amino acid transporter
VTTAPRRTLGTRQAVLLGITAIIGGAPIVLAGAAFAAAGPSVLVAVALVAALAALGALALAELGARFPRSGGPYMFTQRVLGLESAFAVGWLLLFGSLAAAAVFALGFASFGLAMLRAAVEAGGASLAAADAPAARVGLAVAAIAAYGARGWRRLRRPPALLTLAKVVGMAGIGAVGLVALGLRPSAIDGVFGTFFTGGPVGVAQAMGMMVIAYQGFVLLSAAAGELREPARTLPRASLITIAVATVLYLPLFFVTATVGRPDGMGLIAFAVATDATMVAVGAERYFGAAGFWWVALTAVLATLTALEAQLQGASRLARAMAHDGTLPRWLARSGAGGVPRRAVLTATGFAALLVLILPEVRTAGVAAGVIFMAVLALAHLLALLVRRRSDPDRIPYRAPWAPASLWIGGLAALTVSLVNAATVPQAGVTVLAWLLLGSLVYIAALKTQARALDAGLEGADPDVVALRGRRPLVLTPIANPINAEALMSVAHALAPPRVGRVTTLHVMVAGPTAGRVGATPDGSRGTTSAVDEGPPRRGPARVGVVAGGRPGARPVAPGVDDARRRPVGRDRPRRPKPRLRGAPARPLRPRRRAHAGAARRAAGPGPERRGGAAGAARLASRALPSGRGPLRRPDRPGAPAGARAEQPRAGRRPRGGDRPAAATGGGRGRLPASPAAPRAPGGGPRPRPRPLRGGGDGRRGRGAGAARGGGGPAGARAPALRCRPPRPRRLRRQGRDRDPGELRGHADPRARLRRRRAGP